MIRLSCPGCGCFSAMLNRTKPDAPTIECSECGLSGASDFQKKFDRVNTQMERMQSQ